MHLLPTPSKASSGAMLTTATALSPAFRGRTIVANHRARRITWEPRAKYTGRPWLAGPILLTAAELVG